jgi:hypothetical protein
MVEGAHGLVPFKLGHAFESRSEDGYLDESFCIVWCCVQVQYKAYSMSNVINSQSKHAALSVHVSRRNEKSIMEQFRSSHNTIKKT